MKRDTIISIINGYENQLTNAEIRNDEKSISFLREQINEGYRALATMSIYEN